MIHIQPVETRSQLKKFVKLPWRIYRNDSRWVPPLIIDRMAFLNKRKNPFFEHSDADLFLAIKDNEVVGRIAAIKYTRHLETYHDNTGFFGFFECIDDQLVANALLDQTCDWVAQRGLNRIRGPMSFTINDECGLLVDGFDTPQVIMLAHNPPYYRKLVEEYGFEKAQDLYAYRINRPKETPERLKQAMALVQKKYNIRIRHINLNDFDAEIDRIHTVHSGAWTENWGAVPLTREEIHRIGKELKLIVDPDLVFIVEADGKPIGVSVTIPNMNQALKHANGRLFPIGLLKILWHRRKVNAVRVLIMGVLKEYRIRGIDAAMYFKTMDAALRKGYQWGDMSWVLESNIPMRRVLERVGAEIYRTYRIYDKKI